jgi:c-di-GMP phosphodiesterase
MMARARMCEQLGKLSGSQQTGAFFITGLFSMLNVLTGTPTAQILETLPLSQPVTKALLAEEGELGAALKCVRAYERGRWEQVVFGNLPQSVIRAAYVDAVFWAEQTRAMLTA